MKVVKPLRLSLIHRVFDHRKKHIMVTTLAYAFPFSAPRAPVSETELWKMASTELGRFGVLDFWMLKPQAEALVTGACYTGEREKGSEFVRFTLSSGAREVAKEAAAKDAEERRLIDKKLYVFGDRRWTLIGPTEPQMFTRMPVDYAHAFGGEKYDKNPLGKGYAAVKDDAGIEHHPLPNVEDPKHVIKSKGDRPPPASMTAWDPMWPVHFEKKMGSYDASFIEKNGFALADDIDFSLFNVAPPDQRIPEFFEGDEELRVENMHPDKRVLETKLPGFVGRCLVKKKASGDKPATLVDVPLRTDTIHVFPHHERAIVFLRGTLEIDSADASDVELMLGALEAPEDKRPIEHYERVIALRGDKEKGALYALRDSDLMPSSVEVSNSGGLKVGDPLEDALKRDGHLEDNQHARVLREYQENRERLLAQGVEPDKIPPPPAAPRKQAEVDPEALPALFEQIEKDREQAKVELAQRKAEQDALLESICREQDLDIEALRAKAKAEGVGPPRFSAEAELARLRGLCEAAGADGADVSELQSQLDDPNFRAKLLNVEQQHRERYRLTGHMQDPVTPRSAEESAALRQVLVDVLRGEAASPVTRGRRDFTGADLSGVDLGAVDLEGAFLEGAVLKGANLRGARLKDAVLARADLEGAVLANADLERANLGRANLRGADLSGARLADAVLYEADLSKANLKGADLTRANTLELRCSEADFTGAQAKNLFFYKVDLRKAILRGARFHLCVFIECDATGLEAQSSDLSQCVFLSSKGDGASFRDSTVENFRILMSSFEGADFSSCRMPGSNLRGAKLAGANFSGTNLRRSDLSGADLKRAKLDRAILVESLVMDTDFEDATLIGANLMLTIMHRAVLRGADASKSNLFCADLTGAVGDKRTSFAGANVKRALVAGVFHG